MNSPFKFLRRVRIHGGECGAVARALHHKVKGLSLYQADFEKSSRSTNERKQMSTKTTLKRVALVAVSALGFGLLSVAPSNGAAGDFTASFTAPSSVNVQTTAADTSVTKDLGTIVLSLATAAGQSFTANTDTATITMAAQTASGTGSAAQQAKNDALLAKLNINTASSAVQGAVTTVAASAANDYNFATTGQNAINNATVSTTTTTMTVTPASGSFTSSIGRAFVTLDALVAADAAAISGGVVTLTLAVSGDGLISTFQQTLTVTVGLRTAGTATVPTTTGTINAGGTATLTYTSPYTAVLANDAWTERTLTLGGTAVGSTFSATAVATGGAITLTRSDANNIVASAVKSNIAGAYSVTYTIVVTAAATAAAGSTITVAGFTVTVQPYTPAYNSSTLTPTVGTNGYRVSAASGGDGIAWALAADKTNSVMTVAIQQVDQNGNNISVAAYAKSVSAKITGAGSLTQVTNASANAVVKEQSETALNGLLSGNDSFIVYSDGTSGAGKLEISVDGVVVGTYTLRFLGDAASVKATLIYPIGNSAGAVSGVDGSAAARTNNIAAASSTKDVTATSDPAIAVSVLDANGWAIPTTAPIVTSSKVGVVSTATRLFIDSGVSDPSSLEYSAGTFVQHYSYTTLASASGSTSDLTFTFVNTAGTALVSPAVKVTVGGAVAKTTLAFDKATYNPGEIAKLTATATDASGNKAYDGQNVNLNGATTTLSASIGTMIIVDGVKVRSVFAPMASGTWTVTLYDVADRTAAATATVRNPADEALAAAEAASDAAAEAIDAANAATDAANLAAEAADAATVAAEEARDAADAATAAVEELATQVATLMAALKAQITTLANTVAKIAKKVKA